MWDLSSLIRDRTRAFYSGSTESWPLDHQGSQDFLQLIALGQQEPFTCRDLEASGGFSSGWPLALDHRALECESPAPMPPDANPEVSLTFLGPCGIRLRLPWDPTLACRFLLPSFLPQHLFSSYRSTSLTSYLQGILVFGAVSKTVLYGGVSGSSNI